MSWEYANGNPGSRVGRGTNRKSSCMELRDVVGPRVRAERLEGFDAVHLGQLQVHQDEVRLFCGISWFRLSSNDRRLCSRRAGLAPHVSCARLPPFPEQEVEMASWLILAAVMSAQQVP